MAQLGNTLRITLTNARIEQESGGFLPWQRKTKDEDVWLEWKAEGRWREGAEWRQETVAEGRMTGAEIRWWAGWFANAARVRGFPTKLGDAPSDPVARLWTPLAGQAAEFFVWPEPTGALVLMALFMPDENQAQQRIALETIASPGDLQAFGQALEAEYEEMKGALK